MKDFVAKQFVRQTLEHVAVVDAPPIYPVLTIRPYPCGLPAGYYKDVLEERMLKAWIMYRALIRMPREHYIGDVRVVTRAEKIRWWIRCQLVKWGVI